MANFQLDDLLKDDKKDANLIPDFSKVTCNSEEELRRLLECVPEFKLRPDKPRKDEIKVHDKSFSFKTTKRELRALAKGWNFGNPVPPEMRSLNLQELQQVSIDWKMLTPIRPKLRQDEEMFSRLVEMGKLQLKTRAWERRNKKPDPIKRTKNRAGIIETSVKICVECGLEYCDGQYCGDILYESYARVNVPSTSEKSKLPTGAATASIAGTSGKKKIKKSGDKKVFKKTKVLSSGGIRGGDKGTTGGKTARLLVKKNKTGIYGSKGTLRRESERSGDDQITVPKFHRVCSKYPVVEKKVKKKRKIKKKRKKTVTSKAIST